MSPMSGVAIEVKNIHKSYGAVHALSGVDLLVPKGTIVGLLGPNGAGKTTLVRILTTLLLPDTGSAMVGGRDVVYDAKGVREIIGLTGQFAAVDEVLTGRENLIMIGRLHHMARERIEARAEELLAQFDLLDAAYAAVKTYSGGMRRRLDLAASLVHSPPILFLDEPTTGLDPRSRLALWKMIRELKAGGTTVLITTQYLEEADHLADTIVVIDRGEVIALGSPKDIKARVGGDVLEIHLDDPLRADETRAALRDLGEGQPEVNRELGILRIPVSHGAGVLPKAIRALDLAHIDIADLSLRRPTLDEAFLKLTGLRSVEPPQTLPVAEL